MKRFSTGRATITALVLLSPAIYAQSWQTHPTPGIPRRPTASRISPHRRRARRTATRIFPASGTRETCSTSTTWPGA